MFFLFFCFFLGEKSRLELPGGRVSPVGFDGGIVQCDRTIRSPKVKDQWKCKQRE